MICIIVVGDQRNVTLLHKLALLFRPVVSIAVKMAKSKELTSEKRKIIIKLHKYHKTEREIAKIVGRTQSTIHYVIQRFRNTGTVINKQRSGRPSKVSGRLRTAIVKEVKINPRIAAPKIAANIAGTHDAHLSAQTVRNILHKDGYNGRNAQKTCLVREANKKKRLNFAVKHSDKPQAYWNKVIWSDESKFELFSSNRQVKVWRKVNTALDPKNLVPTVKHGGGSVMVWGCMSPAGVGNLVFIDGRMDQHVYKNILEQNLMSSADKLGLESDFVFQQDNDPKHTARSVQQWMTENIDKVLEWPAQSPDLNPIEHLWEHLDRQIHKKALSSLAELKKVILSEWEKIPASVTKKLVDSMPRRLLAVRESKGFPTKY